MVERAFVDERSEQIIVIAKAFGLSWETVKAILLLQDKVKERCEAQNWINTSKRFTRLQVETAKKAIQFYRLRERATAPRLH